MDIKIPSKLSNEITDYCKVNNIGDVDDFILKVMKKGFDLEKWGDINFTLEDAAPEIEEKIVELPKKIITPEPNPIPEKQLPDKVIIVIFAI